jgi:hypothetical protein
MKRRRQAVTRQESKNQGNGREQDIKEMEKNMDRGKA